MNYKRLEEVTIETIVHDEFYVEQTITSTEMQFVPVNFEDLVDGDRIEKEVSSGVWQECTFFTPLPVPPKPIRIIEVGSMQRRFTIEEEIAIDSDPVLKVIKSRLNNAKYCDLDFVPTVYGIATIINTLAQLPDFIGMDAQLRSDELLADGTQDEAYKGEL